MTLKDQYGPSSGQQIYWSRTGANPLPETLMGTTNALGQVVATYTGSNAGEDVIVAQVGSGATATPKGTGSAVWYTTTPPPTPADYHLTTTAGVTQNFTLPLCVPTPINVQSTNPLTPTTIVSLCPVPLALATALIVPPPGQPAQLYLSIQRISGTGNFSAMFDASYTVPGIGTPLTVHFGIDSGSHSYPNNAIVGAASDYNPVANGPVNHLTMGWALDGEVDRIWTGADGVGDVKINNVYPVSGSLALSFENGKFTAQLTDSATLPPDANIEITAPLPDTSGSGSVLLKWTNIPQNFTFDLQPTQVNGQPSGISFNGSQTPTANLAFGVLLDLFSNGALAGRFRQNGFGQNFSESLQLSRDQNGNITGGSVQGSPGVVSNLDLSAYRAGQLAAFVELGNMPAVGCEISLQFYGTVSNGNAGGTISATNAPAFIGAGSYILTNGSLSSSIQSSVSMATGASYPSQPFPVTAGAQLALTISGLNPNFKIEFASFASGDQGGAGGAQGFDISGSSAGSYTASQLLLEAQADPAHRIRVLFNSLPQQWQFKTHLHGTTNDPTGADIFDTNTPDNSAEYKQIYITRDNGSGTYVPEYTFVLQRPGSNTSGSITPAGAVATVFNPPQTFDLGFDYSASNANDVCTQAGHLYGNDPVASGGWISLSAGDLSINVANVFVQGNWSVDASASGPAATCSPDTFNFSVHQDVGGNPDGQVTAIKTGVGKVVVQGFATTTNVTVRTNPGVSGNVTGGRVDGSNSEPNPNLQIHAYQLSGATTTLALHIWGGPPGAGDTGTEATINVVNVPQTFGISFQRELDVLTGATIAHLTSYNPSPQPSEYVTIQALAGILYPGGTLQLIVRSLDTSTDLAIKASPLIGGDFKANIHSANVNPNLTQVISGTVFTSWGSPEYTFLLYRPNADLTGLPTSAYQGIVRWQNMPQSFDLSLEASLVSSADAIKNGSLDLSLQNAQASSSSVISLSMPAMHINAVLNGIGASQNLHIKFNQDLPSRKASVYASGTLPVGFRNFQAYSIYGDYRDSVFTIYRAGSLPYSYTNKGTNLEIDTISGQTTFALNANLEGQKVSVASTNDVAGSSVHVTQYYQFTLLSYDYCSSGGTYYPCSVMHMWNVPRHMNLAATVPSGNNPAMTMSYSGSDNNLSLDLQSLVSGIGGTLDIGGVPNGMTINSSFSGEEGVALDIYAGGTALPYFYLSGWNIDFSMLTPKGCSMTNLGVTVALTTKNLLFYTASVDIQGDAGLTWVKIVPVHTSNCGYMGLQGIRVDGSPTADFGVGIILGLGPGSNVLDWSWTASKDPLTFDDDWDKFEWNEGSYVNWGDGWLSSYVWEAKPLDISNKYTYSGDIGCGGLTAVNPDTTQWFPSQIPFQPGFAQVNNGILLCGNRVAYYQLNPQGLMAEHCSDWGVLSDCPAGNNSSATDRYSVGTFFGFPGFTTDWVQAAGMKMMYPTSDPVNLWEASPGS